MQRPTPLTEEDDRLLSALEGYAEIVIPENVEQFLASQRNGLLATFLQDEIKYGELFDKLIKGFEMMIYIEKFSRDIYGRHEDETGRPRLLGSSVSPEQRRMTIKSMMEACIADSDWFAEYQQEIKGEVVKYGTGNAVEENLHERLTILAFIMILPLFGRYQALQLRLEALQASTGRDKAMVKTLTEEIHRELEARDEEARRLKDVGTPFAMTADEGEHGGVPPQLRARDNANGGHTSGTMRGGPQSPLMIPMPTTPFATSSRHDKRERQEAWGNTGQPVIQQVQTFSLSMLLSISPHHVGKWVAEAKTKGGRMGPNLLHTHLSADVQKTLDRMDEGGVAIWKGWREWDKETLADAFENNILKVKSFAQTFDQLLEPFFLMVDPARGMRADALYDQWSDLFGKVEDEIEEFTRAEAHHQTWKKVSVPLPIGEQRMQ